ncbi:MAG: metallophosphoesterase [Agarilytica sp.]
MRRKKDCMVKHSVSGNTLNNARSFSYNSVQGHHHSIFGVERYADTAVPRWSMTVGCLLDPWSPAARYASGATLRRPILGLGMTLGEQGNKLFISDLHFPYHHKDTFDFLYALNSYYNFVEVIQVGDLFDHHRGSYHESEPDAYGEEEEFYAAQQAAWTLQALFPHMTITYGNHDDIPKRKLKTVGLPTSMLSDMNRVYELDDGWVWTDEYWLNTLGGYPVTHPMILNKRGRWDKNIMKF